MKYDKITTRIRKQTYGLNSEYVDALEVAKKVIQGVHDGVTTIELDNLAAETAASMTSLHPDYSILASRIAVTSLHKGTKKSFYETMKDLYEYVDPKTGESAGMISDEVFKFVEKNKNVIEEAIVLVVVHQQYGAAPQRRIGGEDVQHLADVMRAIAGGAVGMLATELGRHQPGYLR